ncbi:hypothetical protein SAMN05518672_101310 [Chitinophaga sp. CF118]|uniref:hypothetical protein n=1 Tax=Chitinophaga sp. CF118 TaxID=1884367 RepID=UPI0008E35E13|nr:hypothetical protein [Chitinophaga sp. CF118]SFD06834.1 hypothetical protein SAMN05518672_101310 [Chitinophaga sp. CF118]
MKVFIRNASRTLFIAGGITLAATAANAQMKIGDNPSVIEKSAILELSSQKQGLLLPRLPNFTAINTAIGASVVDGMVVYLASGVPANDGIYMRKAGAWVKISSAADAVSNWSLLGNTATDSLINYVGTTDMQALSLRANATEGIRVETDGRVQLKQVPTSTDVALVDVLLIDASGTIIRKQISPSAFKALLTNVDNTQTTFNVSTAADGQVTINAPIMDGAAGKNYGFLNIADWTRFNNFVTGGGFTIGALITGVAAELVNGAVITYNAGTSKYDIQLIAATGTQNGIVTTGAQTFGGDKTFNGNVAVGGTANVTGATTLGSTLSVASAATVGGTLGVTGATTLASDLSVGGNATVTGNTTVTGTSTLTNAVTLGTVVPTATAASYDVLVKNTTTNVVEKKAIDLDALTTAVQFITTGATSTGGANVGFLAGTTGADFNIVADGTAKTVSFNLPDASAIDATHTAVQRGVVSAADQTFAGNKSFASNVAVGVNTVANSTLQVEGSVSMSIKSVTATYAITATDNTILANATGGAFTVTLPTPTAAINGRIYTIKKIGTGGIDNPISVACAASIEGGVAGTDYMIYNDYTFITVQTDGSAWYIVKK